MTAEQYEQWFRDAGFEKTGEGTLIMEEWVNEHDTYIMVTRANELNQADRAAAIERYQMYFGIPGGGGVH